MSFLRKRFKDLTHRKNILAAKINNLDIILSKFTEETNSLLSKIIEEDQLLSNTYWDIEIDSYDNQIIMTYDKKHDSNELEDKLSFLCKDGIVPDYADVFTIENDTNTTVLEISSSKIELVFYNIKKAKDFIIKNNMMVNSKSLSDRINRLRKPLIELEKMSHIFIDIKNKD